MQKTNPSNVDQAARVRWMPPSSIEASAGQVSVTNNHMKNPATPSSVFAYALNPKDMNSEQIAIKTASDGTNCAESDFAS